MNTRKIKLALTVGLLNNSNQNNVLNNIREMMSAFKEVGAYIGAQLIGKDVLNPAIIRQSYAIRFENCVVDLDLVANPHTNSQHVQGFRLRGR